MIASATPHIDDTEPQGRFTVTPAVELLVFGVAVGVAVASYFVISRVPGSQRLLTPPLVALLLIANLIPGIALLMLLGRRIARRRASRSPVGGTGRLHVRLVALFSMAAAIPMILVTIFASLLFQYGVEFWFSDRARGMLENASSIAGASYREEMERVSRETATMGGDLSFYLQSMALDSKPFSEGFGFQLYHRNLSEGAIVHRARNGTLQALALYNPYDRDLTKVITPAMTTRIDHGAVSVIVPSSDRAAALVPFPHEPQTYLYAARVFDPLAMQRMSRASAIVSDYRALQTRSRSLQLRFNAALLIISLLTVGVAVWVALAIADRLVRPVGELVAAARRVAGGDLTARVPDPRSRDEVGTLAKAFNQMTGRLQEQNTALVTANDQLENRRALIEAVMAGVSAGVIATGSNGIVQIANNSAVVLLGAGASGLVGRRLAEIAPELGALATDGARETVVQVGQGETRTLAVRIARTDAGPILTFDDITQQVLDQRRAAWSDVARRIAHEIKNPLTPIQLAAERLQRRYGSKLGADDTTFARLTDTIVRQVGDLRRMVDEFSSFARMPKPVFREEALVDTARQALFLHEVAHPGVRFELIHDEPGPTLVCDRRQISQALTNIVKNAVEAIEAKGEAKGEGGRTVIMALAEDPGRAVTVTVTDTGVGLPAERERIVEPYMTTRARGTGLGLAIVNKIIEEHHGTISFADRPGGGTVVTMTFDAAALAAQDEGEPPELAREGQLATLTRNRT